MFIVVAMLIFSVAMYIAAYYVWTVPQQEAERALAGRMRELRANMRGRDKKGPGLMRQEQRGSFAFLGDLVTWVGVLRRLQDLIEQANLKYRAADVFGISVLIGLLMFAVTTLMGGMLLVRLLIAVVTGLGPVMYIVRVRGQRLRKFEEQLPDAIDLFTRTMRAGHNIHSGLETIAHETADPVRMEFRKLMEELALGSQVEPALHGLGRRVPLLDLKFFIITLILQRQTGANMVSVLEGLSTLVRERLGMAAKLKAHTAQQRFSAGLLCALPIVFGLGCWFLKPDYIRLLWTDETGSKWLTYAIISEIVGILVIRRISNIRV
ncbi:MAG TPA: type II secretion system F family protein [Candidatus Sulfopaludibacter sp.]|jgi:tight adherence protein B|nr:type II secretion system F family protein [Candidatus Sulfopaludibacter sp.]